jgi:uncharacterized membrane protein YphA (DoxX/SURF4 family)|tara:strand:- start:1909 stop:2280 length:372 start_codon:yes stop_codon:yes gene_type:complete
MWLLISTILISLIYVKAGFNKINNFTSTVKGLKEMFPVKTLPNKFYELAILLVIIIEIVAPLVLILSNFVPVLFNAARVAIYSLIIFTILATLLYHSNEGLMKLIFDKNLAIIGGLMAMATLY